MVLPNSPRLDTRCVAVTQEVPIITETKPASACTFFRQPLMLLHTILCTLLDLVYTTPAGVVYGNLFPTSSKPAQEASPWRAKNILQARVFIRGVPLILEEDLALVFVGSSLATQLVGQSCSNLEQSCAKCNEKILHASMPTQKQCNQLYRAIKLLTRILEAHGARIFAGLLKIFPACLIILQNIGVLYHPMRKQIAAKAQFGLGHVCPRSVW